MLILGDISGIQDFLFDVREEGGKQAATLRFRSLRLQLIAECIARRVLWTLDLPEQERLLYCAAGKFAIDATGATAVNSQLDPIRASIEKWLLEHTQGRLRCAIVVDDSEGTPVERNDSAHAKLQQAKLRSWSHSPWPPVVDASFDLKTENDEDSRIGRELFERQTQTIGFVSSADRSDMQMVGVHVTFSPGKPAPTKNDFASRSFETLNLHAPRKADGSLVEFITLSEKSRGAAMLGVLKADADNLGAAFRKALGGSSTFKPLSDLSHKLNTFFGQTLNSEMSATDSRFRNIYTVFGGGDDLLLVGPWDIVIDFASHVRKKFMQEFEADGLTLSAGCAIVKPKFPIHLAAQQAEELLEHAKNQPKDQFALFDEVWKWSDHARIIDAAKQLADWVDAGHIHRGWLHTLLELTLLRRGQSSGRDSRLVPAMATSRLHYHIARNWKYGPTRQWATAVARNFDNYPNPADATIRHLPAILRYAMLATRSKGE